MARLKRYYEVLREQWLFPSDYDLNRVNNSKIERIRQWLISELTGTYGYPIEWLSGRITYFEDTDTSGIKMLTGDGQPFLLAIAVKTEDVIRSAKNHLLSQDTAGIIVVSDGTDDGTHFLRRRFDSTKTEYINDIEPYETTRVNSKKSPPLFNDHSDLEPLSGRFENVFFEAHCHIRDIDGMHSDEALDELCKVLYAKLYDEEASHSNHGPRLHGKKYGNSEEFAASARRLYQQASEYDKRVFGLKIPGYKRSRGVFDNPIRLSSPALIKVIEVFQNYNLSESSADIKGRAFQKVLGPAVRAGMGQYFTPEAVVSFMVEVTGPRISDLILDPFCGSGRFLSACLKRVRENSNASPKLFHEFAFGKLHGIEKSERMVRVAMTDMRLQGDGHSNIRCTDSLLDFKNYPDLEQDSFDLILTNPPFGSLLGTEALSQLGRFGLTKVGGGTPLEVVGLERCIQFLRPGGRIGIVLPDGALSNRTMKYVRDWLQGQAKLRGIISLPIESFVPFGASIKTSIVFARKWLSESEKSDDYPVFIARVDDVGHDSTGRRTDNVDLPKVADQFQQFLNEQGW